MRGRIIRIGNSRGIRIPRILLEQTMLGEEIELKVEDNQIVISSATSPRQGWGEAFKAMAEQKDDQLPDQELTGQTQWDQSEWQW